MGKKTSKDILDLIRSFQDIVKKKPGIGEMFSEIRMMRFKIKPVQGDINEIDLKNEKFIEILWSLGKLDEFFQKEYPRLIGKNKVVFTKILDDLYRRYQEQLNHVNVYKTAGPRKSKIIEMEIFKESKQKLPN